MTKLHSNLSLGLLVLLATLVSIPLSCAQTLDVAVVVNSANPVTNLSLGELREIFAGEKRLWGAGVQVKLIVRAPGCHERLVLLKLLGMSESEYKHYWTAQMFRGEADSAPFEAPSLGMAMEAISVFRGSISLVEARELKPGMKVVRVEGMLPGTPGYPLK